MIDITITYMNTYMKTFKKGRLSNPSYQFKTALRDTKKYYKKGKVAAMDVAEKGVEIAKKAARKSKKVVKKVGKKVGKKLGLTGKKKYVNGKTKKYRKK